MMKLNLLKLAIIGLCISACANNSGNGINETQIECSIEKCSGFYSGPEFVDGDDVAHQFSNEMAEVVGDKLKQLYRDGLYSKVDLSKIEMSTVGMGTGNVVYKLVIPFVRVSDNYDAFTSFDHVGGWNHAPAFGARKKQLEKVLLPGETLNVSDLKTTPEGLQEYWIQWKNKEVQLECAN